MGEDEDCEAEADDVSGSEEEDSGGAESKVGEGEERSMNVQHSPYCPIRFASLLSAEASHA